MKIRTDATARDFAADGGWRVKKSKSPLIMVGDRLHITANGSKSAALTVRRNSKMVKKVELSLAAGFLAGQFDQAQRRLLVFLLENDRGQRAIDFRVQPGSTGKKPEEGGSTDPIPPTGPK